MTNSSSPPCPAGLPSAFSCVRISGPLSFSRCSQTSHDPALGTLLNFSSKARGWSSCFGLSRYVLPRLFSFAAKIPELMLIAALAWCFLVSGAADPLGLSREMGALIAGVGMSTFPYNVDVIAKVTNIRDFFVTLFFVALGMKIPQPSLAIVSGAFVMSLFVLASRLLSVFPVLYGLGSGLRTSLITSINLAQMSEFSLVIVSLGLALKHVSADLVATLTFVFAITSVLSTYLIAYNHEIQRRLAAVLLKLGFSNGADNDDPREAATENPSCFSVASGKPARFCTRSNRARKKVRRRRSPRQDPGDRFQSSSASRTQAARHQMSLWRRRAHGHASPRPYPCGEDRRVHDLGCDLARHVQSAFAAAGTPTLPAGARHRRGRWYFSGYRSL